MAFVLGNDRKRVFGKPIALLNLYWLDAKPSGAMTRFNELIAPVWRSSDYKLLVLIKPISGIKNIVLDKLGSDVEVIYFPRFTFALPKVLSFFGQLIFFEWLQVYFRLAGLNICIAESFHFPVLRAGSRRLLTIHDLRTVDLTSGIHRVANMLAIRWMLRRVTEVIFVSDSVANNFRRVFLANRPSDRIRISVIHNIVSPPSSLSSPRIAEESGVSIYNLSNRPYFLTVGHFEERKNYARYLAAIALLKSRLDLSSVNFVIVGRDSGTLQSIYALRKSYQLTNVHLLSEVSNGELVALYRDCYGVIIPSYYEGFCIPLLEAAKRKKVLACADLRVFEELLKPNSYVSFDPFCTEDIARAILDSLSPSAKRSEASCLLPTNDQILASYRKLLEI